MQTPHPLDSVQMNGLTRERAKAQMRRAEFLVELAARGVSKIRAAATLVVRRLSGGLSTKAKEPANASCSIS